MLVMIFCGVAFRDTVIAHVGSQWLYYLFVLGFGIFLMIVGLIQIFAAKTESWWLFFAVSLCYI
ncbi:MAG: hypothetical protein P4M11_11870 [Candidatus Pacebacteria bacterium]|nr:hypothetical protein [Candidatus Paceibacterota bacterium]